MRRDAAITFIKAGIENLRSASPLGPRPSPRMTATRKWKVFATWSAFRIDPSGTAQLGPEVCLHYQGVEAESNLEVDYRVSEDHQISIYKWYRCPRSVRYEAHHRARHGRDLLNDQSALEGKDAGAPPSLRPHVHSFHQASLSRGIDHFCDSFIG